MSAVEELEEVLTVDQMQGFADFDPSVAATQQLLDELLGRFEDDDSPMFLPTQSNTTSALTPTSKISSQRTIYCSSLP